MLVMPPSLEEAKALDFIKEGYMAVGRHYVPAIDVAYLATYCGYQVLESGFNDNDIIGLMDRDTKTIYVDKKSPLTRKRFTIAHELGHIVLDHKGDDILYRSKANTRGETELEQQANRFAASLLMPRDLMMQYVNNGFADMIDLSQIFAVSNEACLYRLMALGLVTP